MSNKLFALIEELAKGDVVSRQAVRDAAESRALFPEHRFRKAFHQAMKRLEAAGVIACDGDEVEITGTLDAAKGKAPAVREHKPDHQAVYGALDNLLALLEQHASDNQPFAPYRFNEHGDIGGMRTADISAAIAQGMEDGILKCANKPGDPGFFLIARKM